jgi:hypothetical protein
VSISVHAERRYKTALPQVRGLMTTSVQCRRSPGDKIQTQYRPPPSPKAPQRCGAFVIYPIGETRRDDVPCPRWVMPAETTRADRTLRGHSSDAMQGNTVVCKPVTAGKDGGCSAAAVFYREFGVPQDLTIDGNHFKQGVTQSGEPEGRWYATRFAGCDRNDDCTDITFTGNLFDRGWGTDGGEFPNDSGDVWADNYWVDGEPARSGQAR